MSNEVYECGISCKSKQMCHWTWDIYTNLPLDFESWLIYQQNLLSVTNLPLSWQIYHQTPYNYYKSTTTVICFGQWWIFATNKELFGIFVTKVEDL